MTSEDIIRFRNDIVATADMFNLLCGAEIGEGIGRKVFQHNLDKDLVVKIATTQEGVRCNSNEYTLWEEIQGLTNKLAWVKDWFAPVVATSENSNILIMKKTEEKEGKKRPTEIPSFLFDAHYGNFGWIGNKFVCHDYGNIFGFLDYKKKFIKINW